jgi:hypothetical protein
MRRGIGIVVLILALGLGLVGCNKDQGIEVTAADAAKVQAGQAAAVAKQIADIESNPKLSAPQKQAIINQIRAGAARSAAGAQSGKASTSATK